jgi:RNA polymerase sigma factor (sigma-70 family)
MAPTRLRTALTGLRRLGETPDPGSPTDGQLLERFARRGDEAAFELLLWRHGPLVRHVCRQLLACPADADDAFQATFLALVRQAGTIRRRASVRSWLHQVAYRVARRSRRSAARRRTQEWPAGGLADPGAAAGAGSDAQRVVQEEVQRLPEKYRAAVLACYLGGQTTGQAARQLGCPRGTVLSRLAWARRRLRLRLARRGVTLGAGAVAARVGRGAAETGAVPARLVEATRRAAVGLAAGDPTAGGFVSPEAVRLMEGVVRVMALNRLRLRVVGLLVLAGLGLGLWLARPAAQAEPPDRKEKAAREADDAPVAREREVPRPIGTWERELAGFRLTLRIEPDRLSGTCVVTEDGQRLSYTIDADYSVTKDHLLYGVITSLEVPGDADEEAELVMLIDHAFSARFRLVDENALVIKDVKFLDSGLKDEGEFPVELIAGRYKRKGTSDRDAEDRPIPVKKKKR